MNLNQILRLLRPLLRRRGGKSQKWALLLAGLAVGYSLLQPWLSKQLGWNLPAVSSSNRGRQSSGGGQTVAITRGEQAVLDAFAAKQSDVIVECDTQVIKLLPDDNTGDRHQKMLLRLSNGHTILLAHNIDLAKRVPVREGDTIRVRGEYEYSDKGGVLHWTHHAPRGNHEPGWIEYQGSRYE